MSSISRGKSSKATHTLLFFCYFNCNNAEQGGFSAALFAFFFINYKYALKRVSGYGMIIQKTPRGGELVPRAVCNCPHTYCFYPIRCRNADKGDNVVSTTPIYQMFDIIAQSGVGNLGNPSLILSQIFLSMFFEVKFLFSAMKKRHPLVQFSISMIPLVLLATYSLGCGLIFSAFLGKGPTLHEMTALVNVTLSTQCVTEMLVAAAAFFALMLLYSIVYKLNPLQWLMTFGIETLAALALLLLYGGLLVPDFPFTIINLCEQNIYLARWPIYGYYTLLFKCFVLVTSLFLGFVLRERKERPTSEEEKYGDIRGYYERKTLKYLTKNHVMIGCSFLLFSAAAETFFLRHIILEASAGWSIDTIFTVVLTSALFLAPAALGGFLLFRALFPRTSVAYRQLLAMGNQDTVLRLFCEEIVDGPAPEANWGSSNAQIQTAHFLFRQQGIKPRVEWRGERPYTVARRP